MADDLLLVGDVGATNARYALASTETGTYRDEQVLLCESFDSCEASIEHYLSHAGIADVQGICLAVAGPVVDGKVTFPNNPWKVQEARLSAAFGDARALLINDFAAVAMSLPLLSQSDLIPIGEHPAARQWPGDYCVGVIGPGTGLGAAGLICQGGSVARFITEAGHVGFAPQTDLQVEVWRVLSNRFERVSNERVLSGQGLENILSALYEVYDKSDDLLQAVEIFSLFGSNHLATQAVEMLFEILGQVAGDFALSVGAFDGIYLGGGILQKHQELLLQSRFRQSFETKGRQRYIMESIPTRLITHPQPGLLGAVAFAAAELAALK